MSRANALLSRAQDILLCFSLPRGQNRLQVSFGVDSGNFPNINILLGFSNPRAASAGNCKVTACDSSCKDCDEKKKNIGKWNYAVSLLP